MAESYNICLDVGGTKVLGAIFNEKDEIIYRLKKRSKSEGEGSADVEKVIISVVEEMIKKSGIDPKKLNAIASCAPGVIDQDKGIVLFTPNLPWRNYDIAGAMKKKFGVPFFVGNDVNLGVLGEYKFGAARGYKNIVGFFPGTGMGGGLILDGKLTAVRSTNSTSTHYTYDAHDRPVTVRIFRSKRLKKALAAKDEVAMEAVDRACHYLAIATGNMINTISPDLVIYGGGIMEAMGPLFLEKILKELDRYCMISIRPTVDVKLAALGDDSILYGDLALIKGL